MIVKEQSKEINDKIDHKGVDWGRFNWDTVSPSWGCSSVLDAQYGCQEGRAAFRKLFERKSLEFFPYKHDNFDNELRNDLDKNSNNREAYLYEMTTGLFLQSLSAETGYELLKTPNPKKKPKYLGVPDLLLKSAENQKFWVECVIPQKGKAHDGRNIPNRASGEIYPLAVEASNLRLSNALNEKKKQYQKRLTTGVVKEEDYYAVAISGCNLELREILEFGEKSPLTPNIKLLLCGEYIPLNPSVKDNNDFESGIMEPVTHRIPPTSEYFNIEFFTGRVFCKNLFVIYSLSSLPAKDNCFIFCTNLFPDISLLEKMTDHNVTVVNVEDIEAPIERANAV